MGSTLVRESMVWSLQTQLWSKKDKKSEETKKLNKSDGRRGDNSKEPKTAVSHRKAMTTLHKQEGDYKEDMTMFFPRLFMSSKRTLTAIKKEQKVCKLELEEAKKPGVNEGDF